MRLKIKRPRLAGLLAVLMLFGLAGCHRAPDSRVDRLESPPSGFQRHLILVFEREGTYQPVAGALVDISVMAPTRLVKPASGQGRTGPAGEIELVFEPLAHYDETALKVGDQVIEYPIKAKVGIHLGGDVMSVDLSDHESFARYQDPLYRGLDRNPAGEPDYYIVAVP